MVPNRQDDRSHAIIQARDYLSANPIYLDTETTGTGPGDEIVDISIIDHDGHVIVDSLVRPTIPIPQDAIRVHRITNAHVQEAPAWARVWKEVSAALEGRLVGIYNAAFDLRLMRQSHLAAGIPWQLSAREAFCIMELYAQFYGLWDARRQSYRWQSLAHAGENSGIRLPATHRAKDDAILARAVLIHIANSPA